MLGPRYDEQVAEENRFHPSMLSNYLKSLKVKLHFLIIETLLSLIMFTQVLLFTYKEKSGSWLCLGRLYRIFFLFVYISWSPVQLIDF